MGPAGAVAASVLGTAGAVAAAPVLVGGAAVIGTGVVVNKDFSRIRRAVTRRQAQRRAAQETEDPGGCHAAQSRR